MMKFFTYILCSQKTGKYYIGHTQDLKKRIEKHNSGEVKSTKNGRPWQLMHSETFDSRSKAFKREHEIKRKKAESMLKIYFGLKENIDL